MVANSVQIDNPFLGSVSMGSFLPMQGDTFPMAFMGSKGGATTSGSVVFPPASPSNIPISVLQDVRTEVKQLARAYNQEQIWIMEKQMPSFEEYMKNSVITSCIYMMFTALIPGIKSATKEDIDWLLSEPKIVISTAMIGRHLQDLSSHERENREGKLLTVVDCYMKDRNVSKQEALAKFVELVEEGWKNVNTEWVMQTNRSAPKEILKLLQNYARVADDTYKNYFDGYTSPENGVATQIVALFVDPIII
ncbi:hypothetical protein ACS0TY_005712 [Phlomoides rotata]